MHVRARLGQLCYHTWVYAAIESPGGAREALMHLTGRMDNAAPCESHSERSPAELVGGTFHMASSTNDYSLGTMEAMAGTRPLPHAEVFDEYARSAPMHTIARCQTPKPTPQVRAHSFQHLVMTWKGMNRFMLWFT